MRSGYGGLLVVIWLGFCGNAESSDSTETTTIDNLRVVINRGAARQMFGSGSLRHISTTNVALDDTLKVHKKSKGYSEEQHHKPESLSLHESNNSKSAGIGPENVNKSSPVKEHVVEKDKIDHKAAVQMGLEDLDRRKHPTQQHFANPPPKLEEDVNPDRKTLIQELEDETSEVETSSKCSTTCSSSQFLCAKTCTCLGLEGRCDGLVDCENGDDEMNCEEIEGVHFNGTCYGKRSVRCTNSGECIAKEWLCDGDNDCGDFSDESHCGDPKNCTDKQFECRNGLCIPWIWLCDGDNDCKDYSDEDECHKNNSGRDCLDSDYVCLDGTCINDFMRCDGKRDCLDGSDEHKCEFAEVQCKETQFQCAYPRCISMEYVCDGDDDCGDGSDEDNCSTTNASCKADEFRCQSGKCISNKWVCDKEFDCKDGDDEQKCEYSAPKNCTSKEEFSCANGLCIPHQWVCDRVPDCSGGEDEQGCATTCELTQYHCKPPTQHPQNDSKSTVPPATDWYYHSHHRDCINTKHLCDGYQDCPEGDDEENCYKKVRCNKEGIHPNCTHNCILTSDEKEACACETGYILGKDNYTCEDIDECKFVKEPVCSQICVNTVGSFLCSCSNGYTLRPDTRSCKATGANPTLLLANRIDIRQASINGPKYSSVIKNLHNAIALDYHYKTNLIYWSDVSMDVIRRAYINGSKAEDFIRWGLESPSGVAVDWIHDLLFWTDSGTRRVEVSTLETRVRHVLVSSDIDKPRAIVVHPYHAYVYWSDWGPNPKIERAEMDGSDRKALVKDNIFWPNGLTIDYTSERLYWVDAKHRVIESVTINGDDRKVVVSRGLHHPFSITVFEDAIYWTDWHFKSISMANKVNGMGFKTIHSGLHFPMDLHSYHPQRQPEYINHCGTDNGRCSHMCLPNKMGYSCVCPVGLKIKSDKKNCQASADDLLLFARKKDLRLMSLDQPSRVFDTVIPLDNIQSAVALTWDSDDDTIYWTDVEADSISKSHLDGTNQKVIIHDNLESPAGLALDWVTKKLYWTDAGTNRIECSNIDGSMRTLLIYEGLDKPRDIVVDPYSGTMYWSDWGQTPKIEKSFMDGSNRRTIIDSDLVWPNGLAIDFAKKRLYWTDGGKNRIEHSDLEGRNRVVLIANETVLLHPFGLVIHQDKIYWTDWDTFSIHRADKDTGTNTIIIRNGINGLMDVRVFNRNRKSMKNPCSKNNGNCSHLCLLSGPHRITCACPTGLVLAADGRTCPGMPTKFLVLAHRVDIRILSFDANYTADTVLPISNMKNASGADVDLKTGQVYWTDPGQLVTKSIKRASFNGRYDETIIDGCIDTVDGLALDSIGRKIYWTDAGLNSVEVSELDGSNRKVLVWAGLDNPRAIALHYSAGLLFWSDWGHSPRIERADMDGRNRMAIVTEALTWPNGLSVDTENDQLYWNDAKRKIIESSDLDGQNRRVVLQQIEHPYGLAVFGDFVYWSDWHEQSLMRAKKDDGANRSVVVGKLEGIMDIKAINMQDVQKIDNACGRNNGGCSHLCLRSPQGYSCACPTGIILNHDQKSCNSTPTNFLLLAAKKTLVRMSLDTPEMWEVPLPIRDIHYAYSVDFHWEKKLIFYTDIDLKVIKTVNMHNYTDTRIIIKGFNVSTPFRIAVDWVANNIYWTDMKHKLIEVAHLDGTNRRKLIENLREPISLALFPKEGYIYWTEWGDQPKIKRAYLDGKGQKDIIFSDLSLPNGISIDYEARKLYWADALKDRIEMSDLHGRYRMQLVPEAVNAFGLTQYGSFIYWGDWFKEEIERADKRTGKSRDKMKTALDRTTAIRAVSAERQTGWNPCAELNGGCSHLCLFTRRNYTCACPDEPHDRGCSTSPIRWLALRKPGTEGDPAYDIIEDEEPPPVPKNYPNDRGTRSDHKAAGGNSRDRAMSLRTIIITTIVLLIVTVAIIGVIVYLLCQKKNKRQKYMHDSRRNVLTFSNPNYTASTGAELQPTSADPQAQDGSKKGFIWKRLRYDKSQERVYDDSGQGSSPEVVSLIPPQTTTPNSSRAASVTPMDASPPAITRVTLQRLQPSIVAGPKPRLSDS